MAKTLNVPRIETARLIMRGHSLDDFPAVRDLWADPQVTKYISGKPRPEEECWLKFLRATAFWVHLGYGYWIIEEKASGDLVGEVGFGEFKRDISPSNRGQPDIGWALASRFHGRGYGYEAAHAAVTWGDDNGIPAPMSCIVNTQNTASIRIAKKLGFIQTTQTDYHGETVLVLHRERAGDKDSLFAEKGHSNTN